MLWEQFIGPSLKAVRTLVIRPFPGCGNTASLHYPDTWIRKPDCLHLPYSNLPQTKIFQSPKSLLPSLLVKLIKYGMWNFFVEFQALFIYMNNYKRTMCSFTF